MSLPLFAGAVFILTYFHSEDYLTASIALLSYIFALFIHESAHFAFLGKSCSQITLYPFGAEYYFKPEARPSLRLWLYPIAASFALAFLTMKFTAESPVFLNIAAFSFGLGVINILPVFPLDLFSALNSYLRTHTKSDKASKRIKGLQSISILFSFLLLAAGFYTGNLALMILSVTLALLAGKENHMVKIEEELKEYKITDVLIKKENLLCLSSLVSAEEIFDIVINSFQEYFPVLQEDKFLGLAERGKIIEAAAMRENQYLRSIAKNNYPSLSLTEPLNTGFRKFKEAQSTILPVVQDGTFCGLISKDKILEFILIKNFQEQNDKINDTLF